MPATIPTERVDFSCRHPMRGVADAAGWPGATSGRVLVHGLGATHDMMLTQYEQHFAAAGIATLAFDYRNTGASDGQPRQHISTRKQRATSWRHWSTRAARRSTAGGSDCGAPASVA